MNNVKSLGEDHAKLMNLLIEEESVYTNKGRLNKSSLARLMNKKPKELEDLFADCKKEMQR